MTDLSGGGQNKLFKVMSLEPAQYIVASLPLTGQTFTASTTVRSYFNRENNWNYINGGQMASVAPLSTYYQYWQVPKDSIIDQVVVYGSSNLAQVGSASAAFTVHLAQALAATGVPGGNDISLATVADINAMKTGAIANTTTTTTSAATSTNNYLALFTATGVGAAVFTGSVYVILKYYPKSL